MPFPGNIPGVEQKRPKTAENKGTFETHVREMNKEKAAQEAVMETASIAAFFVLFFTGIFADALLYVDRRKYARNFCFPKYI